MSSVAPAVSAITIFFNGERYIRQAIESVLAQDFADWELLLVDDGSTDGSTAIALDFAARHPDRIRYLEHPGHTNRGMSAARNLGLRHARGAYVAFLDCDDVWLPGKFASQVPYMNAHPEVAMLMAATEYWYSWQPGGERDDQVKTIGLPAGVHEAPSLATQLYPLGTGTAPCQCSLLIRKAAAERAGGYEESFRGFYEDQAFLIKMYLSERIAISDDCWDRYRKHEASCSAVVHDEQTYDRHRDAFFRWLHDYLRTQPNAGQDVQDIVDAAVKSQPRTTASSEARWFRSLRAADGTIARLRYPDDNPDAVRVEIESAGTGVTWDVQLNMPRVGVSAGHTYSLTFLARADEPRSCIVGCAQAHVPWDNLGLYAELALDRQWRPVTFDFTASADDTNARLHFDLGGSAISVEIAALTLRDLTGARFVRPGTGPSAGGTAAIPGEPPVEVGRVNFGSFRRLTPLSEDFGSDRGRPVDRHYIEQFMASRATDVRGRVLEIGDPAYTRRYGGDRVVQSDVLHVDEGAPEATIIGDLTSADHIPSDTFDCVILTQTLQLIYDFNAAIRTIHRILKPGGVLLATFPGISQSYDSNWGETWYWNFTAVSARRMFGDVFSPAGVVVQTHGNVLAAISFLQGLATEELTAAELDYRDPGYDMTITVRAEKQPAAPPTPGRSSGRSAGQDDRGLVLMYHRVADAQPDPWGLAVTPAHFAEHLDVLRKAAEVVPLSLLSEALGRSAVPPVVITFDDGYIDNLEQAKPALLARGFPATVFVTTGYTDHPREFWWDELERLLLSPGTLPETLDLALVDRALQVRLGDSAVYAREAAQQHRCWRVSEPPPTARHAAYLELWRALQPMPSSSREVACARLREWAGDMGRMRSTHRPMTADELRRLSDGALIEIGAHTVTHPVLHALTPDDQRAEITASRARLEAILDRPVTSFAYPYGAQASTTVAGVCQAGFMRACTTVPRVVSPVSDRFRLPRVTVGDWDGEEFERRLHAWLPARTARLH